jgi:hypothetical protein
MDAFAVGWMHDDMVGQQNPGFMHLAWRENGGRVGLRR